MPIMNSDTPGAGFPAFAGFTRQDVTHAQFQAIIAAGLSSTVAYLIKDSPVPFIAVAAAATLPTAAVAYRGIMVHVLGAAGALDVVKICMHKADNSYAWQTVTIA